MAKRILIFLLMVTVCRVFALNVDEIINKTLERYENLKTFYAQFKQVYCDSVAGICKEYEGKIYFLTPNFFRMEFENPKQIYVGDSISLWIYLPEENRAIRQNFGQIPFAVNPDMFLRGYEETFDAALTKEDKDKFEITLTPKKETEIYNKIIVTINKKKFEITGFTIIDGAGAENKFNFDKIEMNKNFSKKLFKFNPPKGTKIDEY